MLVVRWRTEVCLYIPGYITLDEFKDACELLGEHLHHPQDEVLDICRSMDINKDGLVDLNEFLETFRLVDMEAARQDSVDPDSDEDFETVKID